VLLYAPLPKVFYSGVIYTSLNLLDLISVLCLRHLCRCPLTITFLSVGILPSFVIKSLPFDYLYSLSIDMLIPLDSSILLFKYIHLSFYCLLKHFSLYVHENFLSPETPSYSIVMSLFFGFFYSLVLVCPYPWDIAYTHLLIFAYLYTLMFVYKHFSLRALDHPCFLMMHERSFYFAYLW
jgi:hypothetical protein